MYKPYFLDEIQYCYEKDQFNKHLYGIQRLEPKGKGTDDSGEEEGLLGHSGRPNGRTAGEDDQPGPDDCRDDDTQNRASSRRKRMAADGVADADSRSGGASAASRSAKDGKHILDENQDNADDAHELRNAADAEAALGAQPPGEEAFGALNMHKIEEELEDDAASKVSYYVEDEVTGKIRKLKISKNSTTFKQMQQIIGESKRLLGSQFERQNNDLGIL